MMNRLKRLTRRLQHIVLDTRAKRRCPDRQFHGTAYGGDTICPSALTSSSVVYSFGVGEDISFDLSLIRSFGLQVFAFDPTPRSVEWIGAQSLPPQFHFAAYGIADYDGTAEFFPPDNPEHVSHTIFERPSTAERSITVPVRRLSTLMTEFGHTAIDLIKLDIEGAEYGVISDMLESSIFPAQVVVEFHHAIHKLGWQRTRTALRQLRDAGYVPFAVSSSGHQYSFTIRHQS